MEGVYSCEICKQMFDRRCKVISHSNMCHANKGKMNVNASGEVLPKKSKLTFCGICSKVFPRYDLLMHHMVLLHPRSLTLHKCNLCQKVFATEDQLTLHNLKEEHLEQKRDTGKYKCNVCSKKFLLYTSCEVHMLNHTLQYPHKCLICCKRFKSYTNLWNHAWVHTDEKPYQCKVCFREFGRYYRLRYHMAIHSDIRPYKCGDCDLRFKLPTFLKSHSKCHQKKKNGRNLNLSQFIGQKESIKCSKNQVDKKSDLHDANEMLTTKSHQKHPDKHKHVRKMDPELQKKSKLGSISVTSTKKPIHNPLRRNMGKLFHSQRVKPNQSFLRTHKQNATTSSIKEEEGRTINTSHISINEYSSITSKCVINKHSGRKKKADNTTTMPGELEQRRKAAEGHVLKPEITTTPDQLKIKVFKCRLCDEVFRHDYSLIKHYQGKHHKNRSVCPLSTPKIEENTRPIAIPDYSDSKVVSVREICTSNAKKDRITRQLLRPSADLNDLCTSGGSLEEESKGKEEKKRKSISRKCKTVKYLNNKKVFNCKLCDAQYRHSSSVSRHKNVSHSVRLRELKSKTYMASIEKGVLLPTKTGHIENMRSGSSKAGGVQVNAPSKNTSDIGVTECSNQVAYHESKNLKLNLDGSGVLVGHSSEKEIKPSVMEGTLEANVHKEGEGGAQSRKFSLQSGKQNRKGRLKKVTFNLDNSRQKAVDENTTSSKQLELSIASSEESLLEGEHLEVGSKMINSTLSSCGKVNGLETSMPGRFTLNYKKVSKFNASANNSLEINMKELEDFVGECNNSSSSRSSVHFKKHPNWICSTENVSETHSSHFAKIDRNVQNDILPQTVKHESQSYFGVENCVPNVSNGKVDQINELPNSSDEENPLLIDLDNVGEPMVDDYCSEGYYQSDINNALVIEVVDKEGMPSIVQNTEEKQKLKSLHNEHLSMFSHTCRSYGQLADCTCMSQEHECGFEGMGSLDGTDNLEKKCFVSNQIKDNSAANHLVPGKDSRSVHPDNICTSNNRQTGVDPQSVSSFHAIKHLELETRMTNEPENVMHRAMDSVNLNLSNTDSSVPDLLCRESSLNSDYFPLPIPNQVLLTNCDEVVDKGKNMQLCMYESECELRQESMVPCNRVKVCDLDTGKETTSLSKVSTYNANLDSFESILDGNKLKERRKQHQCDNCKRRFTYFFAWRLHNANQICRKGNPLLEFNKDTSVIDIKDQVLKQTTSDQKKLPVGGTRLPKDAQVMSEFGKQEFNIPAKKLAKEICNKSHSAKYLKMPSTKDVDVRQKKEQMIEVTATGDATGSGWYKYKKCEQKCLTSVQSQNHMEVKVSKKFKCKFCSEIFMKKAVWKEHLLLEQMKIQNKPFTCLHCSTVFCSSNDHADHITKKECWRCDAKFFCTYYFDMHMKTSNCSRLLNFRDELQEDYTNYFEKNSGKKSSSLYSQVEKVQGSMSLKENEIMPSMIESSTEELSGTSSLNPCETTRERCRPKGHSSCRDSSKNSWDPYYLTGDRATIANSSSRCVTSGSRIAQGRNSSDNDVFKRDLIEHEDSYHDGNGKFIDNSIREHDSPEKLQHPFSSNELIEMVCDSQVLEISEGHSSLHQNVDYPPSSSSSQFCRYDLDPLAQEFEEGFNRVENQLEGHVLSIKSSSIGLREDHVSTSKVNDGYEHYIECPEMEVYPLDTETCMDYREQVQDTNESPVLNENVLGNLEKDEYEREGGLDLNVSYERRIHHHTDGSLVRSQSLQQDTRGLGQRPFTRGFYIYPATDEGVVTEEDKVLIRNQVLKPPVL